MFSFGFSSGEKDEPDKNTKASHDSAIIEAKISRELRFDEFQRIEDCLNDGRLTFKLINGNMKFIDSIDVVLELINNDEDEISEIVKAEQKNSDLLPGIYEGGCKIWEATYDVINYIEKKDMHFSNKKVLDLGCGAGLIGITCMKRGAVCYFQDYNDEVLKYITYPNIKINIGEISSNGESCKFFCGDWLSFSELWQKDFIEENKFDYIFTSETIYNPQNYLKLHHIFQNMLSSQGVIYLAAKAYYFGPGGGLFDFKKILEEKGIFSYKTVWEHTNGLVREILELKFKSGKNCC